MTNTPYHQKMNKPTPRYTIPLFHLFNISYGENDEYYEYEDVLSEIIGDRMYEFVANYFNHHQRGCGKNN